MPVKDPRVDAYIADSPGFARPVLTHIRKLVKQACPGVEETIKWGFPHFMHQGPLCGMAAFKRHCDLKFWKATLLSNPQTILALGRITSLADLPPDKVLLACLCEAVKLNDAGVKVVRPKAKPGERKDLEIPVYLTDALKKNKIASKSFEAFSHSHKKEYVEWLTEAKTEATRENRLATALEWMAEGKSRNWKYEKRK